MHQLAYFHETDSYICTHINIYIYLYIYIYRERERERERTVIIGTGEEGYIDGFFLSVDSLVTPAADLHSAARLRFHVGTNAGRQ